MLLRSVRKREHLKFVTTHTHRHFQIETWEPTHPAPLLAVAHGDSLYLFLSSRAHCPESSWAGTDELIRVLPQLWNGVRIRDPHDLCLSGCAAWAVPICPCIWTCSSGVAVRSSNSTELGLGFVVWPSGVAVSSITLASAPPRAAVLSDVRSATCTQ